jgi:D-glycero-alpha-D-manno-heptose 1-phosphate guanylyltransferase
LIKEAIILAGGLGTRLRSAVPDLPKSLAPVLGRPFIGYLVEYFMKQGIEKFIFALGYKQELIQQYLDSQFPKLIKEYSVEDSPLGTGGAIKLACRLATAETALVLNGDTFFRIALPALESFHLSNGAQCSLTVKPMTNFSRYSIVETDENNSILHFREKQFYEKGLINGGVYALNIQDFLNEGMPDLFSFEKDYLEKNAGNGKLSALIQDAYFIDIGIPADFERAQTELLQEVT